jgi:hypothetical protein
MPPRMIRRRGRKFKKTTKGKGYRARQNKRARQIHSFKREYFVGTLSTSVTSAGVSTPIQAGFAFRLSDLPNVGEYSALFDQYKFTGIKFKVMPKNSNVGGASNTTSVPGYGQIITVLDWDDANNPITKDELLQYGSCKVSHPGRQHHRYFRPHMLNAVYRSGVSFAYNTMACKWIDMTITDVPVYGIKLWVDGPTAVSSLNVPVVVPYDIYATYYFKCKSTR